MNVMQKLLLGITATTIVAADAHAGRWLSRDPIQEGAGFVERDPRPQFDPSLLQQQRGRNEPNVYAFVCNSPVDEIDPLGLFLAASEGYAFRDPWYGSLGWQTGSGFQLSPSAYYDGWASPWLTSICNSGVVRTDPDGMDYPRERTSFVKGYLMNSCGSNPARYRATCTAKLTAAVWGRLGAGFPTFSVKGHILDQSISPSETFVFPLSSDGRAWVVWFQKSVTKDFTATTGVGHPYTLYYLYMPLALQVQNHFRGGFSEHGEATCSIEAVGN